MKTLNNFLETKVRTISIDGVDTYYSAKDILTAIGYKSPKSDWANIKIKFKSINISWFHLKCNRNYDIDFLLASELPKLLSLSNKPKAGILAEKLGHNVFTFKSYIENDTIGIILKAFRDEEMITQYFINGYRIDLYFPQYNLAVECDEKFHGRQEKADNKRQKEITKLIGCQWIRYSPEDTNFNIGDVIYQILTSVRWCQSY